MTSPHWLRRTTVSGVAAGASAFIPRGSARTAQGPANAKLSSRMRTTAPSTRFSCTVTVAAWAGVSTGHRPRWLASRTPRPMKRVSPSCPTGGSAACSPAPGPAAKARAGVAAALAAIAHAGGGLVEAYPEQVAGRDPQRGAYLHTGPESLFEEFGFVRDRRVAKWRWVMRLRVSA